MDLEEVRAALAERFGEQRANHIAAMIMPMIISDFYKMLKAAKPNLPVKEQYYLDDNTSMIELTGYGPLPGRDPKIATVSIDRILIWTNPYLHADD